MIGPFRRAAGGPPRGTAVAAASVTSFRQSFTRGCPACGRGAAVSILGTIESRFLRVHQTIYEATRGAVGHRLIGVPTLLLTSTGCRTGRQRTAALV